MNQSEIVITPNASLGRRANMALFLAMSTVILLIAVGLAMMGFWLVMPFAGLEMLGLGAALLMVDYQNQYREVVSVDDQTVTIASGHKQAQKTCEFDRHWTTVLLESGNTANQPKRLLLRSKGRQVEVGACLVSEDRTDLWRTLKQLVEQPVMRRGC